MGFFDTLKIVGNGLKEVHDDMKDTWKKTALEYMYEYIEGDRFKNYTFHELIEFVYEGKMSEEIARYAACVILMKKFYFYDPYITKLLTRSIWKLKSDDIYYFKNVRNELITNYKEQLQQYQQNELENIVKIYRSQRVCTYEFKESTYYFTYPMDEKKMANHYAFFAASEILLDKYNLEIDFDDLSEDNDADIREKRYNDRLKKAGQIAVGVISEIGKQYFADEDKKEKEKD